MMGKPLVVWANNELCNVARLLPEGGGRKDGVT